jgi:hypothetical protein
MAVSQGWNRYHQVLHAENDDMNTRTPFSMRGYRWLNISSQGECS